MAVRHGYGKVAGADALVFAYDTGDTRNSYKGEPTENLTTDTPSQYGWAGTYTVVNSSTKTFTIQTTQTNAATTSAWRTWYWSVSSYIGSYVTISADVELVSETNCTFSNITIGQGNTGAYPYHIAGSDPADRVTVSDKPVNKVHMTWSGIINATGIVGFTQWINNVTANGANAVLRLTNVQIEAKSHATPFTAGTRSATQGLLDLTGNRTIDLGYMAFDSTATLAFDGASTGIDLGTGHTYFTNKSFSIEAVIFPDTSPPTQQIYFSAIGPVGGTQKNLHLRVYSDGACRMGFFSNDLTTSGGVVNFGGYNHVVMQYDFNLDTSYIYHNGELATSGNEGPFNDTSAQMLIGYWGSSGQHFNGEIPVTKIYNRVLTADEIRNNFRLYKTRFGI